MARFAVGAAAFVALCHADDKASVPPGTYGHDDKTAEIPFGFLNPVKVPGHDQCPVNCNKICHGVGMTGWRNPFSKADCTNACFAHVIETPHAASGWMDTNHQQGKYVQKVMAEYCDRRICKAGLLQHAEIKRHETKEGDKAEEGDKYSPNLWKGDPRAVSSGWPSGCETQAYYCDELCRNMYHEPTSDLGEHFGAGKDSWKKGQDTCKKGCMVKENFEALKKYWDEWCTCYKSPGAKASVGLDKVLVLLKPSSAVHRFVPRGHGSIHWGGGVP
jgi:hypothetical protein